MRLRSLFFLLLLIGIWSCTPTETTTEEVTDTESSADFIEANPDKYVPFRLTADLSGLSDNTKKMIPVLIEASKLMDEMFWYEAYGEKEEFLSDVSDDRVKRHFMINYGPWDRLENNVPFVDGVGPKPLGANFYPKDMTKEEFEQADLPDKASLYTFLRRGDEGDLETVPYREMARVRSWLLTRNRQAPRPSAPIHQPWFVRTHH